MLLRRACRFLGFAALALPAALLAPMFVANVHVQSESAVAAYAFSEGTGTSTVDWSGHSNTCTLLHGPTWTTGVYGNGLSFDGIDDDRHSAERDARSDRRVHLRDVD